MKKSVYTILFLSLISISSVVSAQKTKKVDYAKKIQEATPQSLPQEPAARKLKSDAQDENLKGKVKSVFEYLQESGRKIRDLDSEAYYDEKGYLTKNVSFMENYPQTVTVWGYIDGNRVSKIGYVEYTETDRPKYRRMFIIGMPVGSEPTSERDDRYSVKYGYKYNEQGQLIEKWIYRNAGETSSHNEFKYDKNLREVTDYDGTGDLMSQTFEVLDANGNVIEQYSKDEKGKIENRTVRTYEFDKEGNWIVAKTFEQKKAGGKPVNKLLWTTYRTITYYK